jgi:hypothetical protein
MLQFRLIIESPLPRSYSTRLLAADASNSFAITSGCVQSGGDRVKGGTIAPVSQHSRQLSAGLRKVKMVNAQIK